MRIVIIDDEINCRIVLRDRIAKLNSSCKIVGEASGVESGISLIEQEKPDLVFLDIQMNDGTGFDLLNKLDDLEFELIFTTAFDQYAIKAFKYAATDYLLKPVDKNELSASIERIRNRKKKLDANSGLLSIYQNGDFNSICLRTEDNIRQVNLNDISFIKADGSYCVFNLLNKERVVLSKPLKEYAEILPDTVFLRTHKSYLVNLNSIKSFKYKSLLLTLYSGDDVLVSRRNKTSVLNKVVQNNSIELLKNT